MVQTVVQQLFDPKTGQFDMSKVKELKDATRSIGPLDIMNSMKNTAGQSKSIGLGTLNMEKRRQEDIKRNAAQRKAMGMDVDVDADSFSPDPLFFNPNKEDKVEEATQRTHVKTDLTTQGSCPGSYPDTIADQACSWILDSIKSVKQTIADFFAKIVEEGINLAANVGSGVCLSGAISMVTQMFSFMDPFAPNGPQLPRIVIGALVDIFQAFLVQFLFGSCRDSCTAAEFDADAFCCLPSKSAAFQMTESATDASQVYLIGGCEDNFEAEMDFIIKLVALVDPIVQAAVDGIISFLNIPVVLVQGMLQLLSALSEHMLGVCDYLGGSADGAQIEATFYNTKFLLENTICRPTSADSSTERRGYGCDGIDNDCNFIVDECAEDTVGPTFALVDSRSSDAWYHSSGEVYSYYNSNIQAIDDCTTSVAPAASAIAGACAAASLTYYAEDNCGNDNSYTAHFKLDLQDPTISCSIEKTNLGLLSNDEA